MIFGAVAAYCFLRVFCYPLLKSLCGETELYSNPKLKKSMNIFYHARLYPLPIWDQAKRQNWIDAWWKFAIIGFVSFGLSIFALYLLEGIKARGMN
jgi:hypothetical protein